MPHTAYHRPRTLEEARSLKAETPGACFIAGGTDLLVQMRGGRKRPGALISLRSVAELAGVTTGGVTAIGAMTTLTDVLRHPVVSKRFPALVAAVRSMGSVQIRNVATLGGNLCNASPAADSAPPLLVLGAKARIEGGDGEREIPIEDLIAGPGRTCLGPDDVLTAILLDPPPSGARGAFLRKTRVHVDLALASVAVALEMDPASEICRQARVAAGAVAPTPLRLREVEAMLAGEKITQETLGRARQLARDGISPISDVRASADYRRHITGVLLARAVSSLLNGGLGQ